MFIYDIEDIASPELLAEYSMDSMIDLYKFCFDETNDMIYIISKKDSKVHKFEFTSEIDFVESYDTLNPSHILCDATRNLLLISGGHNLSIFDSSKDTFTMIHSIEFYGHLKDLKFINNDTLLILDTTAFYTLKLYTISGEFDFISFPTEIILEGSPHDRIMYDSISSKIRMVSSTNHMITSFDASTILSSTGNVQDTSNLSLDFLNQKYKITKINRDVIGMHVVELDKKFPGFSNINININKSSEVTILNLLNLDLQLNYKINLNLDILKV